MYSTITDLDRLRMSVEEYAAAMELCAHPLMQKFFKNQADAVLMEASSSFDPTSMKPEEYQVQMKTVHTIANAWRDLANTARIANSQNRR